MNKHVPHMEQFFRLVLFQTIEGDLRRVIMAQDYDKLLCNTAEVSDEDIPHGVILISDYRTINNSCDF